MPDVPEDEDWDRWMAEAVPTMEQRMTDLLRSHGVVSGTPCRWDLDQASFSFVRIDHELPFRMQCVGTWSHSAQTFRWGWANDALNPISTAQMQQVRQFGTSHGLTPLVTPEWAGTHDDGLRMLGVAGLVLHADGVWVEPSGDVVLYLLLFNPEAPR